MQSVIEKINKNDEAKGFFTQDNDYGTKIYKTCFYSKVIKPEKE